MKKTKEELARIARENGAKSKGPVTAEGKAKVSLNALKHGEYSEKLAALVPAHFAAICNEDRDGFEAFLAGLRAIYRPAHLLADNIVRDIAVARWKIERYHHWTTMCADFALLTNASRPLTLDPVLETMETSVRAAHELLGGISLLSRLDREIRHLQKQILFLEKHLAHVHKTYTAPAPEPEAVPATVQNIGNKPTVTTSETDPVVIAAYRRQFPNHQILIVPATTDTEDEEDEPKIPRRAA